MEESSQIESHRPEPLWSLVIVGPLSYAGVAGLVGVIIIPSVCPVTGVKGSEAERPQEDQLQGNDQDRETGHVDFTLTHMEKDQRHVECERCGG